MAYCQLAQRNPYKDDVKPLIDAALDEYSMALTGQWYRNLRSVPFSNLSTLICFQICIIVFVSAVDVDTLSIFSQWLGLLFLLQKYLY